MTLKLKEKQPRRSKRSLADSSQQQQHSPSSSLPCSVVIYCGPCGYCDCNTSSCTRRHSASSSSNGSLTRTKKLIRGTLGVLFVVYIVLVRSAHRIVKQEQANSQVLSSTAIGVIDPFGFFQQQVSTKSIATGGDSQEKKNDRESQTAFNHTLLYKKRLVTSTDGSKSSKNNIWTESKTMPVWMKEYMDWHQDQRRKYLNSEYWDTKLKYMIISCVDDMRKCGGTSDRLKPIPTMIRAAAMSKRLLLVYWNRPCALEEFLLPPVGGIDWRVPDWLRDKLMDDGELQKGSGYRDAMHRGVRTIRVHYQAYDGGEGWYDGFLERDGGTDEISEASFEDVYHDVWRAFFTPTPPIANAILNVLKTNDLRPGQYVSAHMRLFYLKSSRTNRMTEKFTVNAVNCASTLKPGHAIFLASDSSYATTYGPKYGEEMKVSVIVHEHNPDPPLHIDRPDGQTVVPNSTASIDRPPSDFYDTFVDLYLLALGGCSFFGKGGYGLWAAMIGGENMKCKYQERIKKGVPEELCSFKPGPTGGDRSFSAAAQKQVEIQSPFLEPMS
mmetsp:Transcript_43618/g.105767  ORF Transcript_43618/g.105767 Transcript_43618/m.105767 type:complete len:553 (+) Transcript_43618:141-1799(+)